jgi:transcriptional regulator with XRE-family HTH domain
MRPSPDAAQHESGDGDGKATTFGQRLRRYREDREMTLTALAAATGLSKGYLSSLETGEHDRRPSAEVMYSIAEQLGVTMSELMGRRLLAAAEQSLTIPESLDVFAKEAKLTPTDVKMLASIKFRGEQPKTPERWRYIYDSIRNSQQMDR